MSPIDGLAEVELGKDELGQLNFQLSHFSNPEERSNALTASAHAANLPWKNEEDRAPFIAQCNYCHQVGNEFTRAPREKNEWRQAVTRMETYFALLAKSEKGKIVDTLFSGFDGKSLDSVQDYGANELLANTKVEQWLVGDEQSFIHDVDVGLDGKLYGTDDVMLRIGAISFNLKDYDPAEIGFILDQQEQISVRVGLHCAPDAHRTIGTYPTGTIRVSPGYFTTEVEIDRFLRVIQSLGEKKRNG